MRALSRLILFALLPGSAALAETIVCSYPGYLNASRPPVVVEIELNGDTATAVGRGKEAERYRVLENTPYGIVLAQSMAVWNKWQKNTDIGGFFIANR
jgi:hypothetical protein